VSFATIVSARPSVHGQLKLAHLFEMSERDFEARVRTLEDQELFRRLVAFGVLSTQPYENARFAARRFDGYELRSGSDGLSALLDGNGDLVSLISRVGQEHFEEFFLRDEQLTDQERADNCAITCAEARELRELIDRLYVQAEFESPSPEAASARSFSAVAGIELDGGRPVLGFFNRDLWKGRYRVDEKKRADALSALSRKEAASADRLLAELEFVERRKSTLYRVLETLIETQGEFLSSGDPGRRRPLTQRAVAARLDIVPSILNRLISNKSVQLPWGLQAPLKVFMPSGKLLARDYLYDLAVALPDVSDEGLRAEMGRAHGLKLSRRSIAQYRKELSLQGRGLRRAPVKARAKNQPLRAGVGAMACAAGA
jgi:hypothetical protein